MIGSDTLANIFYSAHCLILQAIVYFRFKNKDYGQEVFYRKKFGTFSFIINAGYRLSGKNRNIGVAHREFDFHEITIDQLQSAMESGVLSSEAITHHYLKVIESMDKQGPSLNAIIAVNPRAIQHARDLDTERQDGKIRGPLHGIPVIIKDNIDTGDGLQTTGGSLALSEHKPAQDAFLIRQLKVAGAFVLAKANLSEWANFRSNRSSSGWSGIGGQTKNPYYLDRSPCGSSSGSAVTVAANMAPLAIGTETNGSIICPSSINGIVGIKPTVGLISRSGVIPISATQDTAGPMARTVRDAAILLGALTGYDPDDKTTKGNADKTPIDYSQVCQSCNLLGTRIGVARNYFGFHEEVDILMEDALNELKNQGAELVDLENVMENDNFWADEYNVLLYEFKDGLNKYLKSMADISAIGDLNDLIAFNQRNQESEMPYFKQEIFLEAATKAGLDSDEYRQSLKKILEGARDNGIDKQLSDHRIKAIVAPSSCPAWPIDLINGDHHTGGSSSPAAIAGYPSITVPAGFVYGLPVGISFFGAAYSEAELIRIAYIYEQASQHRAAPQYKLTMKL